MGDGGLRPKLVASSAVSILAWEPGMGERRVLHARGRGGCLAGLGAGVKDSGWVAGGEEGAGVMLPPRHGWESPGPGCADVVPGSSHLSPPLFSQLRQSLLRREKGGRWESIPLHTAAAQSQGANLLAFLGKSQPTLLGRENKQIAFTHPSKHCPPRPGARGIWTLQRV